MNLLSSDKPMAVSATGRHSKQSLSTKTRILTSWSRCLRTRLTSSGNHTFVLTVIVSCPGAFQKNVLDEPVERGCFSIDPLKRDGRHRAQCRTDVTYPVHDQIIGFKSDLVEMRFDGRARPVISGQAPQPVSLVKRASLTVYSNGLRKFDDVERSFRYHDNSSKARSVPRMDNL